MYSIELTKEEFKWLSTTLITCERHVDIKIPDSIWTKLINFEQQIKKETNT